MEQEKLTKKLCPICKTGLESYKLDPNSPVCPYIDCYKNGECTYFVPVREEK